MKCDKCSTNIEPGEDREHRGQVLCEDCYLDTLDTMKEVHFLGLPGFAAL